MPTKKEIQETILAAIKEKVGKNNCSLCGNKSFRVESGYVMLPINDELNGPVRIGGPSLPCIPLICDNCGNTNLLNIIMLGLDVSKLIEDPEKSENPKRDLGKPMAPEVSIE